jgi:hypothetical protein
MTMRPLVRSLFLLSLAAAPLAVAATPQSVPSPTSAVPAAANSAAAVDPAAELTPADAAGLRAHVQDLEATLNGMRRELARLREEEDARTRDIGDPNVHAMWP